MITDEEWEKLKVGDVVWSASELNCEVESNILTKKHKELAYLNNGCCVSASSLFLSESEALKYIINSIKTGIANSENELKRKQIALEKQMLRLKQLEQENGNTHSY